ncbi:MAG TPA: hypothetical protein VGR32_04260 [Brevundimonas sp.]|jgi:hypothetical protein|uniref:hypothetical protein n=1 Tax=Brevundimonas sp. TaxID=1871086 RepID=UPI002DE90BF0|nr:hypothetical protein [Brevundimonas sp.]
MIRLVLSAGLLLAVSTSPVQAQDYVYEVDGQQLTASQAETVRQGDGALQRGLEALQREDWNGAIRDCYAAVARYRDAGLGNYGRVGEWFSRAYACVADAQALSGNPDEACRIYRDNDWETLTVRDPRAICERRAAAETARVDAHDAYSDLFAEFADMTGRLQTLTPGSRERADLGERMYALCGRMAGYKDLAPVAFAGASYCTAIVRFEANQPDRACQILWTAARWTAQADPGSMLAEQARHLRDIDATLNGFRATCADFGHPWPSFAREWPTT